MKKKSDPEYRDYEIEPEEQIEVVSEPVEPIGIEISTPEPTKVRLLNERETVIDGVKYLPVVTYPEDGNLVGFNVEGYLVPIWKLQLTNEIQSVDLSDAIPMYDWDAEISKMLGDYAAVVSRVKLSIWRTGAFTQQGFSNERAAKLALSSAFPYKLSVEDK